jgi:hypothetical protein
MTTTIWTSVLMIPVLNVPIVPQSSCLFVQQKVASVLGAMLNFLDLASHPLC